MDGPQPPETSAQRPEGLLPPPGGSDVQRKAPSPDYIVHGRDLRVDLLRGYFVVAMVVDHVRAQSFLYIFTGGNRFFTSAAEGFILASGLVAGLVYGRVIASEGLRQAIVKVLSRAATLYLITVGVTMLFLPLSEILYLPWAQGVDLTDGFSVLMSILTLHRTYYLIDVLLLYTVLFIFAPIAFALMDAGKTKVVVFASWLLWALYQVYPNYASMPWPVAGNYLFDFSAWQVLFFSGLALGFHHSSLPTLEPRTARKALVFSGLALAALIGIFFVVESPLASLPPDLTIGGVVFHEGRTWLQDMVFSKISLRPGRLVASAVTFTFMYLLVSMYWSQFRRFAGWLLIPLGQHALFAYTAHIAFDGVINLILAQVPGTYPGPWWLNVGSQLGVILLIWLLIRRQILMPNPRTQPVWNAVPAAIFVGMVLVLAWYPTPAHPGLVDPPVQVTASGQTARRFGTPIPAAEQTAIALAIVDAPTPVAGSSAATPVPTPSPTPFAVTASATPAGTRTPSPTSTRAPTATPFPYSWTPTPTPEARPLLTADLQSRLAEYLTGPIKGTLEEQWFYSRTLDRDVPYLAYLPPDYGTAGRRYPVVYMLHGLGGHRDEWVALGLIDAADRAMRNGDVSPMILIMPQGDLSYWVNHVDGPRWGDYLAQDVVRHIDATYRTLRSPTARGLAGISMGAWGALSNAFAHPGIWGVVGGHSPSIRPHDGSLPFLGSAAQFALVDPLALAQTLPLTTGLQIWLDIGLDDPWRPSAEGLHKALVDRGIDHTWQLYPGGHLWAYWDEHFIDYLRFYSQAFSRR